MNQELHMKGHGQSHMYHMLRSAMKIVLLLICAFVLGALLALAQSSFSKPTAACTDDMPLYQVAAVCRN